MPNAARDSSARRAAARMLRKTHLWPPARVSVKRLATKHDRLRVQVEDARKKQAALEKRADALEAELASLRALQPALEMILHRGLTGMNRAIQPDELTTLTREVRRVTGVNKLDHQVATSLTTLIELEARGLGRIAGKTPNIVGKLTATPLLDPPNDDVLEIGTLYGLFMCGVARQLARRGRTPNITVVDPLGGAQQQTGHGVYRDWTSVPIIEETVVRNFDLAGLPRDGWRIIKGLSHDPEIRERAGDRLYGTIVVDGDHGEEAVASDLAWVEQIAATGAVIVMDDYGTWPTVRAAVDGYLKEPTRFTMIGTVASSAFLRAGEPLGDEARASS